MRQTLFRDPLRLIRFPCSAGRFRLFWIRSHVGTVLILIVAWKLYRHAKRHGFDTRLSSSNSCVRSVGVAVAIIYDSANPQPSGLRVRFHAVARLSGRRLVCVHPGAAGRVGS